jgi:hypothetical protein
MAFTAVMMTQFTNKLATKTVNLTSDPLRVILLTAATTGLAAAQDTMATMTDVKAVTGFTELATSVGGSNYTQNANSHLSGQALTSPTWTRSGMWTLTGDGPGVDDSGGRRSPAYAVWFDDIGTTDDEPPSVGGTGAPVRYGR